MDVHLDWPLPAALSVGAGTAVFVGGTCFDQEREIRSLRLVVDGVEQELLAAGMPRLDLFRTLHPRLDPYATGGLSTDPESPEDPHLHSYRSGFWGFARVRPDDARRAVELAVQAEFEDGGTERTALGRIPLDTPERPPELPAGFHGVPRVAVCMATYDPPLELFRAQIESIRAQTYPDWVCVISDDCSPPDRIEQMREVLGDDPRFVLSRSSRRRGFYLNFERALALAPPQSSYVAIADQDDRWSPHKLQSLLDRLGSAQLAYSDARVVGRDGAVLARSYWEQRRNNHDDLASLLVANCVTGAASLLRREVLDFALPFPPGQFAHYHDHWLALNALVLGGIEFDPAPLYDYVQHGSAVLGHAEAVRITRLRERMSRVLDSPRERVRVARARYFIDLMRLNAFAQILVIRADDRLTRAHRRTLARFLSLDRSPAAVGWLAGRAARELSRPVPQTLGSEWSLLQAVLWRHGLTASVRSRPTRRLRLDALPPPDLAPRSTRRPPATPAVREVAEKIRPLELAVAEEAPARVNILIPTIDLEHFFGGYIAKFNLANRLARRGRHVRLVTVDPVGPLPRSWRATLESYSGLQGMFEHVEVALGRGSGRLQVSRNDAFVASTWWTAHIAHAAATELGRTGFIYLVQEYEPFTFPMGSYAALAQESYGFPHRAVFSTELLRDYFRHHRLGVYAAGVSDGDARSTSFRNAITPVRAPTARELASRSEHRLLFYARPESHAARNMFEIGVLSLQRAVEEGTFGGGWRLQGIGTVGGERSIELGPGTQLELLPRRSQSEYARVLGDHDLGLALMFTPHPSLVPIEMASAGMVTVTNTFENKTRAELAAISGNLVGAEPTIAGIAAALREAASAVHDIDRRVAGANVDWSRDWGTAFHEPFLERLLTFIDEIQAGP